MLDDGRKLRVCDGFYDSVAKRSVDVSPFARKALSGILCYSKLSPHLRSAYTDVPLKRGQVGAVSQVNYPLFVAAIDPSQERKLIDLDDTLVSGRPLKGSDRAKRISDPYPGQVVPVIASTRSYVDEVLNVDVERLTVPRAVNVPERLAASSGTDRFLFGLEGEVVGRLSYQPSALYEDLIDKWTVHPSKSRDPFITYQQYWTTFSNRYEALTDDRLRALPVRNPPLRTFGSEYYGAGWAPQHNRDVNYRKLANIQASNSFATALHVVGRYDPEKLPGFSELSQVPLETYYPPRVEGADAESRGLLDDGPLLPTQNLADYIAQPPLLLTTLKGFKAFTNPSAFPDAYFSDTRDAPISVIRVRVAGVTGPDPLSRERIKRAATRIHRETGLAVDITAGSSPHDVVVELPAGKFGRPALNVREGWVEKGVAVRFLEAVDKKSAALFALILVVCAFFLANGAFASVKTRRKEIGTLSGLGWSRPKIFLAVVGELALVGLIAGVVGSMLASVVIVVSSLEMPLARTLLVTPVATALAAAAGLLPAWRAAQSAPLDALRPSVATGGRVRSVMTIPSVAATNLLRSPGRTVLGTLGLVLSVAAVTVLIALNGVFQGALVGNLLGNFISVEIRGVDFLSAALTIVLGALSVANVLYLNLRERAAELVTLRTLGWRDHKLKTLVALEGMGMGLFGSLAGAGIALFLVSLIRGVPLGSVGYPAALAVAAGVVVTMAASLVPLASLGKLSAPIILAEE
ncbi:MAG: ABC transporter permease [Actinobacteria bacterium]|nr:ABC transporter permease [Actinomycetota bacterium]